MTTDNSSNPLTSLFAAPESAIIPVEDLPPEEVVELLSEEDSSVSALDLAMMDLTQVEAIRSRAEALKAETRKFLLDNIDEVRTMLDAVGTLVNGQDRLTGFDMSTCTNYVRSIMVTLREHPEYDGILLPQDLRNIVGFFQANYHEAYGMQAAKDSAAALKATLSGKSTKATGATSKLPKPGKAAKFDLGGLDLGDMFKGI